MKNKDERGSVIIMEEPKIQAIEEVVIAVKDADDRKEQ